MLQALPIDVLVVGGGIAGSWLNARLCRTGYATALVENVSLGSGRSVKSQGIIHGGAKYALHDTLAGTSEAIADMPRRWRACLDSDGGLDLRGVCLLSEAYYLWSPNGLADSLTSFFASKVVRSRVEQAKGKDLSPALRDERFKSKAYHLTEIVFDISDLIHHLAGLAGDSLFAGKCIEPLREGRELVGLYVNGRGIRAQHAVFSAGVGNKALLRELDLEQPAMQRWPLHMVMVKAAAPEPLYAHCLGVGSKLRITVTTHLTHDGQLVWYLDGDTAGTDDVARDKVAQIAEARRELAKLLSQIDLGQAQWAILWVDRAGPAQSNLSYPDNAFLAEQGRLLVGWPTKLALAPDFANRACVRLEEDSIRPSEHIMLPQLPRPPLVEPTQEVVFVWSGIPSTTYTARWVTPAWPSRRWVWASSSSTTTRE